MNALLIVSLLVVYTVAAIIIPTFGPPAAALSIVCAGVAIIGISQFKRTNDFLVRLFAGALAARVIVATIINFYDLQTFFGGDADTYDFFGWSLGKSWHGGAIYATYVNQFTSSGGSGWGMLYLVAGIYELIGRNMFAVQLFNAVIGAATAVIIFRIANLIFDNVRVAWLAALFVAFFPSLVLWSAQALKDGPIVFLLVLAMLATLKISEKFSIQYLILLAASTLGLLTLRFYIFYMVLAAIAGSFVMGFRSFTARSFARQFMVVIALGLTLMYLGVMRSAGQQYESFGNLKTVQRSRLDASRSAESGFAQDVDVSTTRGAIAAIPIGMFYLLFAPLPWQLTSLRQLITLPEMIVWWASFPLLVLGLWFSIKHKLRQIAPILLFTTLLTLAYSVFQGNVGTAYRQRAQLLVFYFVFVAVGLVLFKERREDRKREMEAKKLAARQTSRAFAPFKTPRDFTVKPAFQATTPVVPGDKR